MTRKRRAGSSVAFTVNRDELELLHDWAVALDQLDALTGIATAGKPRECGPRNRALRARIREAWAAVIDETSAP